MPTRVSHDIIIGAGLTEDRDTKTMRI